MPRTKNHETEPEFGCSDGDVNPGHCSEGQVHLAD